ncbi:MAG: MFS transporter [Promethearchaeota archaeon]
MENIFVPRELHGKKLIGYIIGYFAVFLNTIYINVFVANYYIYTINLDSIIVLFGIAVQMLVNAIFSIIFGVISDNKTPGKFGKRRPFLLYGLPIWAVSSLLIWIPPLCPEGNSFYLPTALYFWSIGILNSIVSASILSPHASMLPEQSETFQNRKKVASTTTFYLIIASIIGLIPPLIVRSFLPQKDRFWWTLSGGIITIFTPIVGLFFTCFAVIGLIITFLSVDESFHEINQINKSNRISITTTFKNMIEPLKDIKYRKFIFVNLYSNVALGIMGFIIIPFLDFVMLFEGINYYIYPIVSISNKIGWFFIWRYLQDKKNILKSYKACTILCIFAAIIILLYLFENIGFEIKILIFILTVGLLLGSIYAFRLYSTPIAANLISEAAMKNGNNDRENNVSKISGAYMGLLSFTISFGPAVSNIILAFVFTGENRSNETIIIIVFASMAIFFIISLYYLNQIHIKEK